MSLEKGTAVRNKAVAHFTDGRLLKGTTADFFPGKGAFHISPVPAVPRSKAMRVETRELKALFFVKDYEGKPDHVEGREFDPSLPLGGRKIRVEFEDGEVLVGTTTGYRPEREGFFLEPADRESNNERCYVVTTATREVNFL